MSLYQIVTPAVSLLAILYIWNLVTQQKKTLWEGFLWSLIWLAIAAVALWPEVLQYLTAVTGIKDQVNAVVFTAIGFLFLLNFHLITRFERLEQRHVRLVRAISLLELKGQKDEKKGS